MTLVIYFLLWAVCSLVSFGFMNAYAQTEWPLLHDTPRNCRQMYFEVMGMCCLSGTLNVFGIILILFITGFGIDGFKLKMKVVKDEE